MDKKKKILFVITKSNFGGAQKYVYDLAINLPKERFDVVVAHGGEGQLFTKLVSADIRTIRIGSLARNIDIFKEMKNLIELGRIVRKERPDILHTNSSKAGGLGAFLGWFLRVPTVVFTVHGWPFKEDRPLWQNILIRFFSWLSVIFTDYSIVVSEQDRQASSWMPFVQKKIKTVHNGIKGSVLITRNEARMKLSLPLDAMIIGSNGELHKNKGYEYAIQGFSLFRQDAKNENVIYAIINDGEERERLRELVRDLKLENHVRFLGFIEDAPSYLNAFDIFLLSSIKEGLPYVLLEAGWAEVPIIATNVGGIPEIIEDKKTGMLVPPKNPRVIQEAIEEYLENPDFRRSCGKSLHEKVKKEFSLEEMLSKTITVYNS